MKKKILVPVLGLFVAVLAFSVSDNLSSTKEDMSSVFIESDNIAFAEGARCVYASGWICCYNNACMYNMRVF